MSLKEYLGEIIAFATGGGLLSIFNFLRDNKKDKIEEFEKVIEQWKSIMGEYKENERLCEERYERLHEQFLELKGRDDAMQKEIKTLQTQIKNMSK